MASKGKVTSVSTKPKRVRKTDTHRLFYGLLTLRLFYTENLRASWPRWRRGCRNAARQEARASRCACVARGDRLTPGSRHCPSLQVMGLCGGGQLDVFWGGDPVSEISRSASTRCSRGRSWSGICGPARTAPRPPLPGQAYRRRKGCLEVPAGGGAAHCYGRRGLPIARVHRAGPVPKGSEQPQPRPLPTDLLRRHGLRWL